MDLSLYKPTELEQWINKHYQDNGIYYASDLCIQHVAEIFNVDIQYYDGKPFADWDDEYSVIFLNAHASEEQKREQFFHELSHPLQHVGNQADSQGLMELQEIQAGHFQMSAAMPVYMIEELIHDYYSLSAFVKGLSEAFKLPVRFVQKRLEQIENRLYWADRDRNRTKPKVVITNEYIRALQAELGKRRA